MKDFKKYTVLIVDDDEDLREVMSFSFQEKGFTVLSAGSGSQAFELVKANQVHLVISDVRMPEGDGISLLKQVRGYNLSIPVILVTGFSDVPEEQALAQGAKRILIKPVKQKALLSAAFDALGISEPSKA